MVYRISELPDPAGTAARWRSVVQAQGLADLYLVSVESRSDEVGDPAEIGFDAALEFQPHWPLLTSLTRATPTLKERLKGRWKNESPAKSIHGVYDYRALAQAALTRDRPPYLRFPCVTPSWDNTARRKWGGIVLNGSTPALYGDWLQQTVQKMQNQQPPESLLFINAWNEWAEGNHLEPDQRWGSQYLEATRRVLQG